MVLLFKEPFRQKSNMNMSFKSKILNFGIKSLLFLCFSLGSLMSTVYSQTKMDNTTLLDCLSGYEKVCGKSSSTIKSKRIRDVQFKIEEYYYVISASNANVNKRQVTILGTGKSGKTAYLVYLVFSNDENAPAPAFNEGNNAVIIYYKEWFLPTVQKILEGKENADCHFYEYSDGHIWAEIVSKGILGSSPQTIKMTNESENGKRINDK